MSQSGQSSNRRLYRLQHGDHAHHLFQTKGAELSNVGDNNATKRKAHSHEIEERAVPRYFFNVCNGRSDIDYEGTELADVDAAKTEAARLAAGIIHEDPRQIWLGHTTAIEVANKAGHILFVVLVSIIESMTTGSADD